MSTEDTAAVQFRNRLDPVRYIPDPGDIETVPVEAIDLAAAVLKGMYDTGQLSGAKRSTVAAAAVYTAAVSMRGLDVTQHDVADATGTTTVGIREWLADMAAAMLADDRFEEFVGSADVSVVRERLQHLADGGSVTGLP